MPSCTSVSVYWDSEPSSFTTIYKVVVVVGGGGGGGGGGKVVVVVVVVVVVLLDVVVVLDVLDVVVVSGTVVVVVVVVVVVAVSLHVFVGADQSVWESLNGVWLGKAILLSEDNVLKLLSVSLSDLIL